MKMCKALEELKEQGKSEGRLEGRLEGESRSFILIQKLFSENKIEEVKRVSEDKAYREEMYEKYGLQIKDDFFLLVDYLQEVYIKSSKGQTFGGFYDNKKRNEHSFPIK